jgi:hypothetical protein
MEPQKVSAVPGKAKPGTDALDPPRGWAEGSIRTDRLVSALATASKGYIAIAPSRLMGCSPCMQLARPRDTPDAETNDWRAVCGKTARTVRRAGRVMLFPTPIGIEVPSLALAPRFRGGDDISV